MCRIGNGNSAEFQDSGGISGHVNGLALATAQRTNLKMVIWLISVQPARSLKLIYRTTGRMNLNSDATLFNTMQWKY
jgi:hypothetical protein